MPIPSGHISQAPLFIGMTESEVTQIANQSYLTLRHHAKGSMVNVRGNECTHLIMVTKGWMETEQISSNEGYRIVELVQAPQLLEPDKLFGISHHYHTSIRAYTACESIAIPKDRVLELMERSLIFRLNMLNILCRRSQLQEQHLWQAKTSDDTNAIIQFIREHCSYPTGKKTIYIKMTQLAKELNRNRLEISVALNAMAEAEKIILKRGIIEVPALQML